MKQLIVMIVLTLVGTVGVFLVGPFYGVAVYYLFAVLRPQDLWKWSLPPDIQWSLYVAVATIIGGVLSALSAKRDTADILPARRFTSAHKAIIVFGVWISLTYLTAMNRAVAFPWFIEYLKIFVMFVISSLVVQTLRQLWILACMTAFALAYIGYEINFMYLFQGFLSIYHDGYGGLDNNGAGLMLAMGIPLCLFLWEGTSRIWRWAFLLAVPILIHAVLMSYSRGAMVSLIAATPFLLLRSRRRGLMLAGTLGLALLVPTLAGKEIRERFFTLKQYEAQESAQSRFGSWQAALAIASDYPVFGIGLRNADLVSQAYGADMENRTIHSQYLQTAADSGFVGLGLYLLVLATSWLGLRRVQKATRRGTDDSARTAYAIACGVESAMAVFCVGALFLSLEVFELPYLMLLIAAQLPVVVGRETVAAREPAPASIPEMGGSYVPALAGADGALSARARYRTRMARGR